MTRILSAALTAAVLAAGLFSLAACSGSNLSFQVGNCINWSIGSDGNQVPMKVSCQHPPDPDIDVVRAIALSGQSCRTGEPLLHRTGRRDSLPGGRIRHVVQRLNMG